MFLGFAALITGVAAYSIWGQDMFPREQDPRGEPETWTADQLRKWLESVSVHCYSETLKIGSDNRDSVVLQLAQQPPQRSSSQWSEPT